MVQLSCGLHGMTTIRRMNLLLRFFSSVLYVQLSPRRLTVRDPNAGAMFDDVPEVAVHRPSGRRATIRAVGAEARAHAAETDVVVVNPLLHPRTLVADFVIAELLLKQAVRRLYGGGRVFMPSPDFVMHPVDDYQGGLTQIEIQALRQLALGTGARKAQVWQGPVLNDEELRHRRFPATGKLLA